MSKTIKISDKNIDFLKKFRKYKRETWNDLFDKIREKLEKKNEEI